MGSTSGIIRYAAEHEAREYIICTGDRSAAPVGARDNPGKKFLFSRHKPGVPGYGSRSRWKGAGGAPDRKECGFPGEQSEMARRALEQMLPPGQVMAEGQEKQMMEEKQM